MLELKNISIKLGNFQLKDICLKLEKGDYHILLGKSGVGKTVLLEIIAGLVKPNAGTIILDHEDISKHKIQNRKVGIVFQDYAIFPHLNVRQNILYPIKHKKVHNADKKSLLHEYAELTNTSHLLDRNTQNLSGGELQRVALARTLITQPNCLLLDEPLASLDVQLKGDLRNLLRQINQRGVTILHVTHDYEEAIALSNKVAVMHQGKIIQDGNTREVFQKPANEFVANFTGIKNFFIAQFIDQHRAKINGTVEIQVSNSSNRKDGKIIIRGEEIILSKEKLYSSASNNFLAKVKQMIPFLINYEIIVDIGIELSVIITEESKNNLNLSEEQDIWVAFKSSAVKII